MVAPMIHNVQPIQPCVPVHQLQHEIAAFGTYEKGEALLEEEMGQDSAHHHR